MKTEQLFWSEKTKWESVKNNLKDKAQITLIFGSKTALEKEEVLAELSYFYPNSTLIGCSTAGEIMDTRVHDNTIVATAIYFERTPIKLTSIDMSQINSKESGKLIASQMDDQDLKHIIVISEGLNINGSELVRGLRENLPKHVGISGGLAGDGGSFKETCIIANGKVCKNSILALGLYGEKIQIASASLGGWDSFGPSRKITRSKDNILYELDGKSALELYKSYLGEHAKELPGSGLLFPLSILENENEKELVRTILGVDEKEQSITFAGDVPEGWNARLMKANFDRLVDGAVGAATLVNKTILENSELAILISCVGRKMVLGQRTEEEVEGVRDVLGTSSTITGFYSYGEISPHTPNAKCELHNQTMTITAMKEDLN